MQPKCASVRIFFVKHRWTLCALTIWPILAYSVPTYDTGHLGRMVLASAVFYLTLAIRLSTGPAIWCALIGLCFAILVPPDFPRSPVELYVFNDLKRQVIHVVLGALVGVAGHQIVRRADSKKRS